MADFGDQMTMTAGGELSRVVRDEAAAPPVRRVVVLGASNVARAMPTILQTAGSLSEGPLDLLAAYGHGRSYGKPTKVLFRRLSSILHCGLWDELSQRRALPMSGLLTDIGNDILYGYSPATVVRWVEECAERLERHDAKVVVTQLPVGNLEGLAEWRFQLARRILVPSCCLTLEEVSERSRELADRLAAMCERRGLELVPQPAEWYGLDPIHHARGSWKTAWQTILSEWRHECDPREHRLSWRERVLVKVYPPEQRWLWGREQRAAQPVGRLGDGTSVSLY